jgi:hypothetical protein
MGIWGGGGRHAAHPAAARRCLSSCLGAHFEGAAQHVSRRRRKACPRTPAGTSFDRNEKGSLRLEQFFGGFRAQTRHAFGGKRRAGSRQGSPPIARDTSERHPPPRRGRKARRRPRCARGGRCAAAAVCQLLHALAARPRSASHEAPRTPQPPSAHPCVCRWCGPRTPAPAPQAQR